MARSEFCEVIIRGGGVDESCIELLGSLAGDEPSKNHSNPLTWCMIYLAT